MKVALYHNLTSGGSKREAYEFARQFVRHGHTLDLYHPSTANEEYLPLGQIVHQSLTFELYLRGDYSGRLPLLRRYVDLINLSLNLNRLRQLAQRIAAQIDAGGYDFVLAHHDRIVQSPYLFRFLKTCSAYYCAEPMREFYEPPVARPYLEPRCRTDYLQRKWYSPARRMQQALIKTEDRRNIQFASMLLTNSYFSAESIYRAYGLRARVSYLGVDTAKFKPLNLQRQDFVLSVGAVSPLKGYDFLIEAMGMVPANGRPRLVIVGNTASVGEMNFLRQMAEYYRVNVDFCINVSEEKLVLLYNQARALVYSPVLEPFGFAPLEAMACATPVIAVREGGVRESVIDGETGFLVPRDPALFAEALGRALRDASLAKTLGQNGCAHVLGLWTWDHAYAHFMENFHHLETQHPA
jgi:glycosyltransferase involved in cell wall biosynthesis